MEKVLSPGHLEEKYVGYWQNDDKHGPGIYNWPDGEVYVGQWENGLKSGEGMSSWARW